MIGSTSNPSAGPEINVLAIGMPLTTDFCDPQNTIALSSERSNPNTRQTVIIITRADASSVASTRNKVTNLSSGTCSRSPSTTDALKVA
jgi:hypothetical protein